MQLATMLGISPALLSLLIVIAIWDGIWKLIALWKAATKKSILWFIFLAVLNTAGILPIIYIFGFSKPKPKVPTRKLVRKKKR